MKIALITSATDHFIADMVCRLKEVEGVDFNDIVFWDRQQSPWRKIRYNLKKNGIIYIPYRLGLSIVKGLRRLLCTPVVNLLLAPAVRKDLYDVCREQGITIHETKNVHSDSGVAMVRDLDLDLLLVCGTGILKSCIFDLPRMGTINLHQGDVKKYKGAPPGFWELWNDADEIGVTVHFVNAGVDTGDIIRQRIVPIFPYDTLSSLQDRVADISLDLYPRVLRRLVAGDYKRIQQEQDAGKQYFLPTLQQRLRLWSRTARRRFSPRTGIVMPVKVMVFLFLLFLIHLRDRRLLRQGKTIVSVLYYHRVTDICHDGMTTGRSLFENQIRFLKKHYRIISAGDLLDIVEGRNHDFIGKKCCLITFDDGYRDNFTNGLPILVRYGCPGLFFISTGMIGNDRQFPHDQTVQPRLSFAKMSWEQLRQAKKQGVDIGIHTHTHANLGSLSREEAIAEIDTSIGAYTKQLGEKPQFMSIPFGQKKDIRPEQVEYIRKQTDIRLLFSAYGGKNITPVDPYDIKRSNIAFERKFEFWMRVEGHLSTLFKPHDSLFAE